MKEIWKPVKGYEGLYEVSNLGRVRTVPKKRINGTNYYIQKSLVMKPQLKSHRYYGVYLTKNKVHKNLLIHRLVAEAFIENPNQYDQVNHIDCNKLNNCVSNLEWCNQEMNLKHAYDNGLQTKRKKCL